MRGSARIVGLVIVMLAACTGDHAAPQATATVVDPAAAIAVRLVVVTGCPVAQSYGATWTRLTTEFGSRGVDFAVVVAEPRVDAERATTWATTYGYGTRVAPDPSLTEAARLGATHSPQAIVSDRQGQVVYRGRVDDAWTALRRRRAAPSERTLEDAINAALRGEPPPKVSTPVVGCLLERR